MAREAKKTAEADGPAEEGIVMNLNLEGITVPGIPEEQAEALVQKVAKEAVSAVREQYEGQIKTLQESVDALTTRAEAAETARDAAVAKFEGVQRRMAFDKLFDKHAVPEEEREEMFADFEGVSEEKADKILARFDVRETKGDLPAEDVDPDIVPTKQKSEGKVNVEELGREYAKTLLGKTN